MTTPTQITSRTFYSSSACLVINVNTGQRVMENGQSRMIGQKVAEFSPMADGFGRLVTDDPEVIEKLDARMGPNSDVFDGAEYTRRTTPVEIREKMAQRENSRLIEENNRLLQMLQSQGKLQEKPPSK